MDRPREPVHRDLLERAERGEDWPAIGRDLHSLWGGQAAVALACFKMLLLERWSKLEEGETAAAVADRISWRRFCGLDAADPVDAEALSSFRARLAQSPAGRALLEETARRWREIPEPLLSIVSPVYLAEEIVDELVRRLLEELGELTPDFEIVLVDDGSPDRSWERIEAACARDSRVKGIKLSRNFGQHFAITAGLDHARGRWAVVMDCDLQDDPRYIRDLWAKAREGYDVVYTIKERRQHGAVKNLFARVFATALDWLTAGRALGAQVGAYSILSHQAVEAFREVRETHRHYLGVLRWLGFPSAAVAVRHQQRHRGRSSYTAAALLRHALVGLTSQSDRLLYLALAAGGVFLCAALLAATLLVTLYFLQGFREGWTSTVVLILLSTSTILFAVGAVGIYVGKIFDQVKQRPLYLTQKKVNL